MEEIETTETTDLREMKTIVIEYSQQPAEQSAEQPAEPITIIKMKLKSISYARKNNLGRDYVEKVLKGKYTEDGREVELPCENEESGKISMKRQNAPDTEEMNLIVSFMLDNNKRIESIRTGLILVAASMTAREDDPDSFKSKVHDLAETVRKRIIE